MKAETIEEIIKFLENKGIKTKYEIPKVGKGEFNRLIEFEVEGVTYFIEWWINQSYLKFKNEFGSPYLPFKFIEINPNSPTTSHRLQLCFYDLESAGDKQSKFYNPIPFGCLKIPFNAIAYITTNEEKKSLKRHLAKTISYRIMATCVTISTALFLGVNLEFSVLLGVGEIVVKPFFYFIHERLWFKLRFNKK